MTQNSKLKTQNSKPQFKIQNFGFLIAIFIFTFYILNFNCYAQPLSSIELINNAKDWDGKVVVYAGEVIGDIMVRGKYAWINVNDGKAAIGVLIDKGLTKDIIFTGGYNCRGDRVEVVGVFHRACLQHGGDLDIHAQKISRVGLGKQIQEGLNLGKRNLAIALLGVLCLVLILRQLKIKQNLK